MTGRFQILIAYLLTDLKTIQLMKHNVKLNF